MAEVDEAYNPRTNPSAIVKEGMLKKQSRHLKRWKPRWMVLIGHYLYSFKDAKEYDSPTEVINLQVFSSVKSSEDFTGVPNSFDVYSQDFVFSLASDDETEKEDWIRAIGKAIVMSQRSGWFSDDNDKDPSEFE